MWNLLGEKGHIQTEETRRKISATTKGQLKGPMSEEHKRKISESKKKMNLKYTEKRKKQLSEMNTGSRNGFYGRKHTEETKRKIASKFMGANSSFWKGGIAQEPYSPIWGNKKYKKEIRDRDNNECQNPSCWGKSIRLNIHHINYDKKNCHPDNLITLCISCNSRANSNRDYWEGYYNAIILMKKQSGMKSSEKYNC